MKSTALFLFCLLSATPWALTAQTTYSPSQTAAQPAPIRANNRVAAIRIIPKKLSPAPKPLSRIAMGVGVSPLGPQLQVTTNLNKHFNLRSTGNYFNYSTNFTTNGINATAKMNLASAGASLDIYPFRSGFRISPGALYYNQNRFSAVATVPSGTTLTLNGNTYYSATANATTGATPVNGTANLGLNTTKPAFTLTTGWGNVIPSSGRHLSFPFEMGVAFIGAPTLNVTMGGWVCQDQAQTECASILSATQLGTTAQADLSAQVAKWTNDLNPLKTYPIVSFGVTYSFKIR